MAKAVTIYGIKNCDTMKKARAWLDERGVTYEFHDYKSAGVERSMLERWARQAGWEALINRAGRTFRALPEKDQDIVNRAIMAINTPGGKPPPRKEDTVFSGDGTDPEE